MHMDMSIPSHTAQPVAAPHGLYDDRARVIMKNVAKAYGEAWERQSVIADLTAEIDAASAR